MTLSVKRVETTVSPRSEAKDDDKLLLHSSDLISVSSMQSGL